MGNFGNRLKQQREKRGMTLDDIALATKIGTRSLRALEEERFDKLPGGIFNKGFVRAYARQVGLDEEQAVADYMAAAGEPQPVHSPELLQDLAQAAERQREEAGRGNSWNIPWGSVTIVLLVVAGILAGWSFYSREPAPQPAVQAAPATAEPAPRPPVAVETAPTRTPARTTAPPENTADPAAAPAAEPAANLQPPAPSSDDGQAGLFADGFVVTVHARENSWLSLTVDGKTITSEVLVAPGEKIVKARQKVVVKAGNIGGLDMTFNGKRVPPQGEVGEVKTLTFGPSGLQPQ